MLKHLPPTSDIIFAKLSMYGVQDDWRGFANISHDDYKNLIENIYIQKSLDNGVSLNHLPAPINTDTFLTLEQRHKAQQIDDYGKALNAAVQYLNTLKSLKSRDVYTRVLNIVANKYGNCDHDIFDWSTIRYYHLETIISDMRKVKSSGSRINSFLTALKGTARQSRKLKQLSLEDFESIIEVKSEKTIRTPKHRFVSAEERELMYNYLQYQGTILATRNLALIALMLGCGLRRDEICNLKLFTKDGLTLNKKTFLLRGKGDIPALINMPKWVSEWVDEWLETRCLNNTQEGEYVFVRLEKNDDIRIKNKDGSFNQLTGHGIANILNSLCIKSGIDIFKAHDLRATFCTNLINSGVDINTVRKMMRHSSINTTMLYDRSDELKMLEMWEKAHTK
jgi:site-specific recombinase XerD